MTLWETARGQFVRITEVGPKKNCIIIPASGLEEFCRVLGHLQGLPEVDSAETGEVGTSP